MANLEQDVKNKKIDSIFHLGDHAYNLASYSGRTGDGYMNAFSKILADFTWVPVLGNHEFLSDYAAYRYMNMTYDHHEDGTSCSVGLEACTTHAHNIARPVNALLAIGSSLGVGMHG